MLGKLVVPRALSLADQSILFTGYDPFHPEELSWLLPSDADSVEVHEEDDGRASEIPEKLPTDVVIIGRTEFSRRVIRDSIESNGAIPKFLPQEGFIDEILFGHDWWSGDGIGMLNATLDHHPGLQYVKSLEGFPWPSTEAYESVDDSSTEEAEFREKTPLFECGYRITGLSKDQRWKVLKVKRCLSWGWKRWLNSLLGTVVPARVRKGVEKGTLTPSASGSTTWID